MSRISRKYRIKFHVLDIHIYRIHDFDIGLKGKFSTTIQEILDNQSNIIHINILSIYMCNLVNANLMLCIPICILKLISILLIRPIRKISKISKLHFRETSNIWHARYV